MDSLAVPFCYGRIRQNKEVMTVSDQVKDIVGVRSKDEALRGIPDTRTVRPWRACEVADCMKNARLPTLRCKAHGGGTRCIRPGCDKSAVDGYDRCRKDGGGPRCQQEGCSASTASGYDFCYRHHGGKRCSHPNCTTTARAPEDLCGRHGGGRCAHPVGARIPIATR